MRRFPSARLAALVTMALSVAAASRAPTQTLEGAFHNGDRILLRVEGEAQLSDTFAVGPGPGLVLPVIGEISLAGVQRAGVEPYLAEQLGRFLKSPVVQARALIQLSLLGEVARPGFYAVPADAIVSDALMAAGGPTREAKFSGLRVERDGQAIWTGDALQRAIARTLTADQMGLRTGDRIIVPRRRDTEATVRTLGILVTIPAAIYAITKVF